MKRLIITWSIAIMLLVWMLSLGGCESPISPIERMGGDYSGTSELGKYEVDVNLDIEGNAEHGYECYITGNVNTIFLSFESEVRSSGDNIIIECRFITQYGRKYKMAITYNVRFNNPRQCTGYCVEMLGFTPLSYTYDTFTLMKK